MKISDKLNSLEYWSEEWIQEAIKELDLRAMTPMERDYAERQIIKAVMYNTSMKEREEAMRERDELKEQLINQITTSALNLLAMGMPPEKVATALNISLKEVLKIKQTLEK